MRPLVINEQVVESIKSLVKYAEGHIFSMDDLLDIYNKQLAPAGDDEAFVRIIPVGYRVVFSIEEQVGVKVRHLSISIDQDDKLPGPHAVTEIMNLIGFKNAMKDCLVKTEPISQNRAAINIIEIIE